MIFCLFGFFVFFVFCFAFYILVLYHKASLKLTKKTCRQLYQKVEEAINPQAIIHFSAIFEDNFGVMGKVVELSQRTFSCVL